MSLNISSISDATQHNHKHIGVASLNAYRSATAQREQIKMSHPQANEFFHTETKIRRLELSAQSVLYAIAKHGEVSNKAIRGYTGLTIMPVNRLTEECIQQGLILKRQTGGHPRSPWLFRLNPEVLSRPYVLDLLDTWNVSEKVAKAGGNKKGAKRSTKNQNPPNFQVPKPFKPYFNVVKSSAREALWEAFLFVAQVGTSSAGALCKDKDWSSTVGGDRLKKLIEAGLLGRRMDGVYIYFLTKVAIRLCREASISFQSAEQRSISASIESHEKVDIQNITPTQPEPEDMSNKTLSDLASAVTLLAHQVATLNKRMEKLEKGQSSQLPDFNLREIERLLKPESADNSQI